MSFRRSQLSIAALFFALGFQYSTWASRIPALADRLHLSAAEVGVLLLAAGVGAVVSAPLVPKLMTALGSRRLALAAVLVLAAALAGLETAPGYRSLLAVLLIDGVAVGCLNVAMNAQGAALEKRSGRTTMARLHATFSGGIFGAALLASAITSVTGSVAVHFAVAGAVLLAVPAAAPGLLTDDLPAASSAAPSAASSTATSGAPSTATSAATSGAPSAATSGASSGAPSRAAEPADRRWSRPSGVVVGLGLAMLLATITEGAVTDWSALYLKTVHAADHLLPLGIAVTSGMMLLARFFADGWRDRWGDRAVVAAGSTLAGAGLLTALLTGGAGPALAGFACVGLGMAAVSPCLYVAAARHGPAALTAAAAMSTTGLLVGPPAIGFLADVTSLRWGLGAVVVTAWLTVPCALLLRPRVPVAVS
ncbi:MFS transporter [Actinoplanes xinjiangensis]|uniref:MFS transporter n=1 Tax=Actinoplanes xinjiangensis TaxID=512350 RepID=A0A316EUE8_9ACTN|nr:MFS transporter [Actinoplanes xinjiangensis]PWK35882.1 MFS transporter [Actinoplanes xinjiangensis]GIF43065.1 MFS transporter [Actinoplanes xinjiangensis]